MTYVLDKATGNIKIESFSDGTTTPSAELVVTSNLSDNGIDLFMPYDSLTFDNLDTINKIVNLPLIKSGTTYNDIILKREIDETYKFVVNDNTNLDNIGILLYTTLKVLSPQTFKFKDVNVNTIEILSDSDGTVSVEKSQIIKLTDDRTNLTTNASIIVDNATINTLGDPNSNFAGTTTINNKSYIYTIFGKYNSLEINSSDVLKVKIVDTPLTISDSKINNLDISGANSVLNISNTKIVNLSISDLSSDNINIGNGSIIYNMKSTVDIVGESTTIYNVNLPSSKATFNELNVSYGVIDELNCNLVHFIDPIETNKVKEITINKINDGEYILDDFATLTLKSIISTADNTKFKLISSETTKTNGKNLIIENLSTPIEINSSNIEKIIIKNIDDSATDVNIAINGSECSLYVSDLKDKELNISGSSILTLNIDKALDNAKVNIISSVVDDISYNKDMKAEVTIISSKIGNVDVIYGKYPTN